MTNSMGQTHYEALEVSEDATDEELKAARKRIMRDYHPDNFNDHEKDWVRVAAAERSQAANAAYDVLKNPTSRADYDRKLRQERERAAAGETQEEGRPEYDEEPWREDDEARAEDGWAAWDQWEDAQDREEDYDGYESERAGEQHWEEEHWEEDVPEYQPPPPPPSVKEAADLLPLSAWAADRIPLPVHLVCGAMVSGIGWVLAILVIGQQSIVAGIFLTLAILASIPIAGGILYLSGLSLSKTGMVLVAIGGGLPVLLVASAIPFIWPVLLLGSVAWAAVMVTATYARWNKIER